MSAWEDALINDRIAEAKAVFAVLFNVPEKGLSSKDMALMEALGYLSLELDGIKLSDLCDYDLTLEGQ